MLLIGLTFLCACRSFPVGGTLPAEDQLRFKLQNFHQALGQGDIAVMYELTSPQIRKRMSLEAYKKDLRWDKNAHRRRLSEITADLTKSCPCEQQEALRCVLVVDLLVKESGKAPYREQPLETWDFQDGHWSWVYMGPDTGGRCPGEK
jgi:hypothetical protein